MLFSLARGITRFGRVRIDKRQRRALQRKRGLNEKAIRFVESQGENRGAEGSFITTFSFRTSKRHQANIDGVSTIFRMIPEVYVIYTKKLLSIFHGTQECCLTTGQLIVSGCWFVLLSPNSSFLSALPFFFPLPSFPDAFPYFSIGQEI